MKMLFQIRMPEEVHSAIKQAADKEQRSMANWIERTCRDKLRRDGILMPKQFGEGK